MLLAIDVGNTNTKFAVYDGQNWLGQWRAATYASRTADEYAPWLGQIMATASLGLGDITACIISTVVPQALFNLRNLSRRYCNVEPMVIGERVRMEARWQDAPVFGAIDQRVAQALPPTA